MTDENTIHLLKKHGFKWYKDDSTDRVETADIKDIVPAANGFTVIYKEPSALICSTAQVQKIEIPDDLDNTWIFVRWITIKDERKEE